MAKIRLKRRKREESIRIQVHAKFPVPPGYSLNPDLVTKLVNRWCDGDSPDPGEVTAVDWDFEEGKRKGRKSKDGGTEVDQSGSLRNNLINRFRGNARQTSFRNMGPGENEERQDSDIDDFDD